MDKGLNKDARNDMREAYGSTTARNEFAKGTVPMLVVDYVRNLEDQVALLLDKQASATKTMANDNCVPFPNSLIAADDRIAKLRARVRRLVDPCRPATVGCTPNAHTLAGLVSDLELELVHQFSKRRNQVDEINRMHQCINNLKEERAAMRRQCDQDMHTALLAQPVTEDDMWAPHDEVPTKAFDRVLDMMVEIVPKRLTDWQRRQLSSWDDMLSIKPPEFHPVLKVGKAPQPVPEDERTHQLRRIREVTGGTRRAAQELYDSGMRIIEQE